MATGNSALDTQAGGFGLNGFVYENGTNAITATSGTYICAYFNTASVIASMTVTNAQNDSLAGAEMPAGTTIYGDITAITLTSGSVFLYKR